MPMVFNLQSFPLLSVFMNDWVMGITTVEKNIQNIALCIKMIK